ncbi:MAG: enoyl-CoA hydratase-related protein [Pontixanthobacter sp.]
MSVRLQIDGPIARLVIDRPEKRGAMNLAMWQAVPELLDEAANTSGVRALCLQSVANSGAFCAGADIGEMIAHAQDADWLAENQAAIFETQHRLARFALPSVAFIDGDCIGGGCGLALACDIRVATQQARFGITPARLGLVYPFHDVKLLVDLVGPGQARRLLYTGELIDTIEARDIGLIEIVASSPDRIERQIAENSPRSQRALKGFVRRALDGQVDDDATTRQIFADAFRSADFSEGTAAFADKRRPRFSE